MSITDELREAISKLRVECEEKEGYGVLWYPEPTRDEFSAIADRIDEKHEECAGFCRQLEDAAKGGAEVTIFGTDYIPLPKDADGVTIRIGDVMDNTHKDGFRAKRVTGICYHDGGETTIEVDEDRLRWHNAYKLHHVKPDSWERIIHDALHWEGSDVPFAECHMTYELVERCKRLAGDAE